MGFLARKASDSGVGILGGEVLMGGGLVVGGWWFRLRIWDVGSPV